MPNKSTEELMNILKDTSSKQSLQKTILNEEFEYSNVTFADYFAKLIRDKALNISEIVKESKIERTYCYHIIDGRKQPGRDKVIALCIAAQLNIEETQRCLTLAKHAKLYAKNKRDAILIFSIEKKLSIIETNSVLSDLSEEILN